MIYSVIEILDTRILILGSEKQVDNIYINPAETLLREVNKKYPKKQHGAVLSAIDFLKNYSLKKRVIVPKLNLSSYSPKQIKVYKTLQSVKFGETISYKELACLSGFKNASRFVGTTMRINRFPIIIPCHRVITSSGAIGNYAAGPEVKRILLDFEAGS